MDEYFTGIIGDGERFVSANELWTSPWDECGVINEKRLVYDARSLVNLSVTVKSRSPPKGWQRICTEFPSVVRKVLNANYKNFMCI